jgi:Domain of unknown function (DUF4124)
MRPALLLLATLAFACGTALAQNRVYRCADAKGQTVFQQSPCGGNTAGSHEVPKAADAASAPAASQNCGRGSEKGCKRQPGA